MNIVDIEKIVQKEINNRRLDALKSADLALKSLFQNIEIKKAYENFQALKVEYSRQLFLNNEKESKEIAEKIKKSKVEFQNYLSRYSINPNEFKPKFFCKKCNDKGAINGKKCACFKNLLSKKLVELSGLSCKNLPSFKSTNYDLIENARQRENLRKVAEILKSFGEKIESTKYNIVLLCGLVGVGKTYQMECLINELIESGYFVVYETAFNFNQNLINAHLSPIQKRADIINQYIECDCFCIDDLGTEQITKNVTIEYLYSILNERMIKNKKTIITTNLDMVQLNERYGERIFSRLVNSNVCLKLEISGDDLRINRKNNQ